ncbi:MAG: S-methyl-5-thioribose-1-phosphate isomerase [Pseudomonadota bacterium]
MDVITWQDGKIKLIDQTKLPLCFEYVLIDTVGDLVHAIKTLKVRGAPAIGIAGAFGAALAAHQFKGDNKAAFFHHVEKAISALAASRPTAVNLFWALERMRKVLMSQDGKTVSSIKKRLLAEAQAILEEDKKICRDIGRQGAKLVKDRMTILTHCNAGGLATVDYGTALGVMYAATEQGKKIRVFVDETRPLLQGARLTAWELLESGIEATLICDNMAASVMGQGLVDMVIVGADRIAANGDTANKIGTYGVAILAQYHKIPFYIAAPLSTFDFSLKTGKQIPIETRNEEEVTSFGGKRVAPAGIKVYNPAFDVTPHQLITGFITEQGVFKAAELKQIAQHA